MRCGVGSVVAYASAPFDIGRRGGAFGSECAEEPPRPTIDQRVCSVVRVNTSRTTGGPSTYRVQKNDAAYSVRRNYVQATDGVR
jgi:hypothetical protein